MERNEKIINVYMANQLNRDNGMKRTIMDFYNPLTGNWKKLMRMIDHMRGYAQRLG
jgi:hypothetical protein